MWRYENKITEEITDKTNNSKNLFDNIRKLKGEYKCYDEELEVYDITGKFIVDDQVSNHIINYWENVQKQYENKIPEIWSIETREMYKGNLFSIKEYGKEIIMFKGPANYNEHLDMALEIVEVDRWFYFRNS